MVKLISYKLAAIILLFLNWSYATFVFDISINGNLGWTPYPKDKSVDYEVDEDAYFASDSILAVSDGVGGYEFPSSHMAQLIVNSIAESVIEQSIGSSTVSKVSIYDLLTKPLYKAIKRYNQAVRYKTLEDMDKKVVFYKKKEALNLIKAIKRENIIENMVAGAGTLLAAYINNEEIEAPKLRILKSGDSLLTHFSQFINKEGNKYYLPAYITDDMQKKFNKPEQISSFTPLEIKAQINRCNYPIPDDEKAKVFYNENIKAKVQEFEVPIAETDIILLASDGLYDNISSPLLTIFVNYVLKYLEEQSAKGINVIMKPEKILLGLIDQLFELSQDKVDKFYSQMRKLQDQRRDFQRLHMNILKNNKDAFDDACAKLESDEQLFQDNEPPIHIDIENLKTESTKPDELMATMAKNFEELEFNEHKESLDLYTELALRTEAIETPHDSESAEKLIEEYRKEINEVDSQISTGDNDADNESEVTVVDFLKSDNSFDLLGDDDIYDDLKEDLFDDNHNPNQSIDLNQRVDHYESPHNQQTENKEMSAENLSVIPEISENSSNTADEYEHSVSDKKIGLDGPPELYNVEDESESNFTNNLPKSMIIKDKMAELLDSGKLENSNLNKYSTKKGATNVMIDNADINKNGSSRISSLIQIEKRNQARTINGQNLKIPASDLKEMTKEDQLDELNSKLSDDLSYSESDMQEESIVQHPRQSYNRKMIQQTQETSNLNLSNCNILELMDYPRTTKTPGINKIQLSNCVMDMVKNLGVKKNWLPFYGYDVMAKALSGAVKYFYSKNKDSCISPFGVKGLLYGEDIFESKPDDVMILVSMLKKRTNPVIQEAKKRDLSKIKQDIKKIYAHVQIDTQTHIKNFIRDRLRNYKII